MGVLKNTLNKVKKKYTVKGKLKYFENIQKDEKNHTILFKGCKMIII